jgi:hypothetical protein
MRNASYQDAIAISERLNLHRDEIWNIIKDVPFTSITDLSMYVHRSMKVSHLLPEKALSRSAILTALGEPATGC